jgi:hypothetical protein
MLKDKNRPAFREMLSRLSKQYCEEDVIICASLFERDHDVSSCKETESCREDAVDFAYDAYKDFSEEK